MARKLIIITLISILAGTLLFYFFPVVPYLLEQGRGQLKMVLSAKDISDVMEDDQVPDSIKTHLLLIRDLRDFSVTDLGLKVSKNYTTYYKTNPTDALILLTASKPFAFENHEWYFPIVGTVSYKGFFNHERAKKEEKELRDLGYDTDLGKVGAWSTLGWFKDPVTTRMLRRSEGQLANLIIHELSHGTIYIKNETELNENIATFIGNEGAKMYLIKKYGPDSQELKTYNNQQNDEKIFSDFILKCMDRLEHLYSSYPVGASDSFKSIKKYQLISQLYEEVSDLELHDTERAKQIFGKDPLPNNTFFLSYKRYQNQQTEIELKYNELGNNIADLIAFYKTKYP